MIEVDWNPERNKLRQFGWIALVGFGVLGTLLALGLGCFDGQGTWTWPSVVWLIAAACPILGYVFPRGLRTIYIVMMAIALPIGFVISTALLILLYFLMFTPLAMWFRIVRRDELKRRWDTESNSYWIPIKTQRTPASYYRQF